MTRRRASTKTRASRSRTPTRSGQRIDALGERVDAELARRRRAPHDGRRADLRLDRRHGRRRVEQRRARARRSGGCAEALLARLRERFAPGGAAALRPGQVVSGRAAAALGARAAIWRTRRRADLARSRRWLARSPRPAAATAAEDAERFADALAAAARRRRRATSCRPTRIRGTTCARRARLPVNVDPLDTKLDDPQERARLRRVFERGLGDAGRLRAAAARAPRTAAARAGRAAAGCCARAHLFLMPGDSPIGLRLPLAAPAVGGPRTIAHVDRAARPAGAARRRCRRSDARDRAAPPPCVQSPRRRATTATASSRAAASRRRGSCAPRSASSRATAGCTSSCRRSTSAEDYLELVAAIEDTAAAARHAGRARRLPAAARSAARTHRASRPTPA